MGDRLVFVLTVLTLFLLFAMGMYGAVHGVGRLLYGPRTKAYEPAPARIDRRGPRGPLRPPSKPPEWCGARHARPRRFAPHPDVPAPRRLEVPPRPDAAPLMRTDPDATAELSIPHELVEETAA